MFRNMKINLLYFSIIFLILNIGFVIADTCINSNANWQYVNFTNQNSTFTAEFDVIPNQSVIDAVTGLLMATSTKKDYQKLAAIVRFNSNGNIDVRNNDKYQTEKQFKY